MIARLAPQLFHTTTRQAASQPLRRSYASAPAAKSNTLLYGALAALAGGGAYVAFSGNGISPKEAKLLEDKAKKSLGLATTPITPPGQSVSGGALSPDEFRKFKLVEKSEYNHNTSYFSFELPGGKDSGLSVASCLVTKSAAEEGEKALLDGKGKPVVRPYTPVTSPGTKGRLDLLVKKYPDGKMTNHIHSLEVGDQLAMKGPYPKWPYQANQFESIAMIAGGSGITPHWQIIQQIDSDPTDKTKVTLLFSNHSEKDILLRKEFESLSNRKPDQFSINFVLDEPPPKWTGMKGFLNASSLKEVLPDKDLGDRVKIFVCGPPGQVKAIAGAKKGMQQGELDGALKELGYTADQVYKF